MGTWDARIFGSDIACDVRDEYRTLIQDGVSDDEATRRTLRSFQAYFKDERDGTPAIVAFALAQSQVGRLDAKIRDLALAAIDRGGDLAIWEEECPEDAGKRKAALAGARAQLTGPQPARKTLRPPRRRGCDLVAGDVLALPRAKGPRLLRVVRVKSDRRFETPLVEELVYRGKTVPPAEAIAKLPARVLPKLYREAYRNGRFEVMMLTAKCVGWEQAGFRKVAHLPARPGDEDPEWSGCGTFWDALAGMYRRGARFPGE